MIELPEAATLARQVTAVLSGKCILHAVADSSPHKFAWYSGDPAAYRDRLAGQTIQGAVAYGNHVEIQAGEATLVISTPIRYHRAGETPPKKHQLYLEFEDCTAISCTVQMWGALLCFRTGEDSLTPDARIAREKPSPLTGAFDWAYFAALLDENSLRLPAKAFLATEQRIPGLGNGVLQDILWTARIHPRRMMGDLSPGEIEKLYLSIKDVLTEMTEQGGRDTERDLFGNPGGYRVILSKNTVGGPCPACGQPIQKAAYLGGAVYFCARCQPL